MKSVRSSGLVNILWLVPIGLVLIMAFKSVYPGGGQPAILTPVGVVTATPARTPKLPPTPKPTTTQPVLRTVVIAPTTIPQPLPTQPLDRAWAAIFVF